MRQQYLEHANITVNNLNRSIEFVKTAFPDYKVRGEGFSNGRKWIHIGDDQFYLALFEAKEIAANPKDMNTAGINHIGFVVDNVSGVAERLIQAGFKRDYPKQVEEFRIRDYFIDDDGNEFEFVQYLSEKPNERNQY